MDIDQCKLLISPRLKHVNNPFTYYTVHLSNTRKMCVCVCKVENKNLPGELMENIVIVTVA